MLNLKDNLYIATFQEKAVEVSSDYGVGLEINHTCISESLNPENREKLLASISADIKKSGSEKAILHGPFTEIHPAAIDCRAREFAAERLQQAFEVCRALSIEKMIVHSGWIPFIYFKQWQAEKSADFWQKFMSDKPENFKIYIENVLEDEPFMAIEMMKKTDDPRIRLCLDIGHANAMTQNDIPITRWIEVLGPYIGHFHLHNNDGTGDDHGDFASGTMDMNAVFKTIEDNCRDGLTFTIEARNCRGCMEWLTANGYI